MPDGHPDVQFGRLEFQVFGRFGILEQDPFVFMTQIAVRIDMFFHAAEVIRKFLTDRNPFFMFLDRHLSVACNLLGHGTPHLALQIKKFLFKLCYPAFLGLQSPVALLDGFFLFSQSGFVVGLHPFDVRQFLQLLFRFHRPPELGITVAEQLLDEGFLVGGF